MAHSTKWAVFCHTFDKSKPVALSERRFISTQVLKISYMSNLENIRVSNANSIHDTLVKRSLGPH